MYSPKKVILAPKQKYQIVYGYFFGLEEVPATDFNKSRLNMVNIDLEHVLVEKDYTYTK